MAEYRAANQSLVLLAQRDLGDFWAALNLSGDPTRVRDALLDFFPELVAAYGDTAALLGADWYDALRDAPPSVASFTAVMARPVDAERAQGAARWALGPLFTGDPDPAGAFSLLSGSMQRLVMQPGRDTVFDSASGDPAGVRFARIPSGATTCRFCTMIASRGFVYATAESAGLSNRWHDKCDCVITPGRGPDDYPEGFDLESYQRLYREGSGVGRDIPTD